MITERRQIHRVPVELFLNEYVQERPGRALATNLSNTGMYVNRVLQPHARRAGLVQLEFELPGTREVIWAAGEARYEVLDDMFHGTGVRFVAMARAHERLVRDFVATQRARRLRATLDRIRKNRCG